MIIDIHKMAEDQFRVAYICKNGQLAASLIIVDKTTSEISALITGDQATAAGSIAKIRKQTARGNYPDKLSVETG